MFKKIIACAFVFTSLLPGIASACQFSYYVYSNKPVRERIDREIPQKVTDEFCKKYSKKYEIVIIADPYTSTTQSLGHAIVGFRKKGSKDVPANNRTAYQSQDGNYAISVSYDFAANAAMNSLTDAMSDISSYLN